MGFKLFLVRTVIKWTPNALISLVANLVLKDIAKLTSFNFDLDTRTAYLQIQLEGESETIDVWVDGFAIKLTEQGSYKFFIEKAESNRIWLKNILSRIVGKEWKIPVTPQTTHYIQFVAELLKVQSPV